MWETTWLVPMHAPVSASSRVNMKRSVSESADPRPCMGAPEDARCLEGTSPPPAWMKLSRLCRIFCVMMS